MNGAGGRCDQQVYVGTTYRHFKWINKLAYIGGGLLFCHESIKELLYQHILRVRNYL